MFRNSIRSCICRCLYIDYFPVEDEADAQEVKQKYNGWTIERDYRYDVDGEMYYVYVKTPMPVRELRHHEKDQNHILRDSNHLLHLSDLEQTVFGFKDRLKKRG